MAITEYCYNCKYFERWCYNTGGQEDIDNEDYEDYCHKDHTDLEFYENDDDCKCPDYTKKD